MRGRRSRLPWSIQIRFRGDSDMIPCPAPLRAGLTVAWATRRAELDRRVAASSAAVAEAMRDAGDLADAAVYRTEADRLAREAEAAADAWCRSLDRVRELLAAARTAEAVAGAPEDADDDPRAHHGIARAFRREAAQLRRSLLNPAKSGP